MRSSIAASSAIISGARRPNGGRVLVVLDGLDKAAGWEAGADLFPTIAPGHLRVIVAARPLALDKDETAWLNRLGWEMPNRAQRIPLAGLDREGVRDVLSQMGNPLDALATKIDLISKLYELSAGDPLLVRLYVEALLPQGAEVATFTPDALAKLQPGYERYSRLLPSKAVSRRCAKPPAPSSIPPNGGREKTKPSGRCERPDGNQYAI